MKVIELEVTTGFAGCNHVDQRDLPIHWEKLSDEEKQDWINEAAQEYLHECCEVSGELVDV